MSKIKTAAELAKACLNVAKNHKTLYVHGCFGAPMTAANKPYFLQNTYYNAKPERQALIRAASADTFGFDCVCLIKGLLWGWSGNKAHAYGGATYRSNGVPDINADMMIQQCKDVSGDFSDIGKLIVGEALWMKGHIGIYVGDGLAVECTPIWKDGVQITAVNRTKAGYNTRTWTSHGKLPYVTYPAAKAATAPDVGDIVQFTGRMHYISAYTAKGAGIACKPGTAKVTAVCRHSNAKRKYHLVAVMGGGSDVCGWVDDETVVKPTAK